MTENENMELFEKIKEHYLRKAPISFSNAYEKKILWDSYRALGYTIINITSYNRPGYAVPYPTYGPGCVSFSDDWDGWYVKMSSLMGAVTEMDWFSYR